MQGDLQISCSKVFLKYLQKFSLNQIFHCSFKMYCLVSFSAFPEIETTDCIIPIFTFHNFLVQQFPFSLKSYSFLLTATFSWESPSWSSKSSLVLRLWALCISSAQHLIEPTSNLSMYFVGFCGSITDIGRKLSSGYYAEIPKYLSFEQ